MADFTVTMENGTLPVVTANSRKARNAMPETFNAPNYERGIAQNDIERFMQWIESKGFTVNLTQC